MYNPDLLYKRTATAAGVQPSEARSAVIHYFSTVKDAVRNLEAPAYYIDHIGTISVRMSSLEKEMKKRIQLYRFCKRFYHNNPVRHHKIIDHTREEITRLNRIRHQLKDFYAEKKANRNSRVGKTFLATQMGYYRGSMDDIMAEDKQGQNNPG